MSEIDYKEAYEAEHLKCADLASRVAELEAKNEDLTFNLNRIKNNPLWKASKPARSMVHWAARQKERVSNLGGPRGIAAKLKYKKREKLAMKQFGTASFPSEEQAKKEREEQFPRMVKISILVPLWNNDKQFQIEMLDSVMNQTYQNWELCLADGSDEAHAYIGEISKEYAAKSNGRIVYKHLDKNLGIAGNTNACVQMATGEFIGLLDQDDILHPSVLYEYVKVINEQNADYIYCDETTFKSGDINQMLTMHFKPDFAPDNLRANNYICHFSVFAKSLMDGDELFRPKFDGSQDHDMILRLTDNAKHIVHVPRLMYYWRCHTGSVASGIDAKPYAVAAAKGAITEHLKKHGYDHFQITSTRAFETIFRVRYEVLGNPKISIIIPNKDHVEDLKRCITSILERSTYDNYEIIIVENNSESNEIKDYYSSLLDYDYTKALAEVKAGHAEFRSVNPDLRSENADSDPENHGQKGYRLSAKDTDAGVLANADGKIKIVTYQGKFNYSAVNNLGETYAQGEYILLLNNDTEVITVNWMEELLMYAQREDVGAVGAKLYYPNKTIQHAGVVLGLGAHRTAGHSHYGCNKQNLGYMGRLCYAQNVSAVTGACLLVKKALFEQVGGLDESFEISLNDVDFCLKLREKNLLNVFTPFCELYHYESVSRGLDNEGEKAKRYNEESERFREKWKSVLEKGDPYYNPNFSLDRSDFSLKVKDQ